MKLGTIYPQLYKHNFKKPPVPRQIRYDSFKEDMKQEFEYRDKADLLTRMKAARKKQRDLIHISHLSADRVCHPIFKSEYDFKTFAVRHFNKAEKLWQK